MIIHLDDTINFINKNDLSFTEGLIKLTNYEIDHKEETITRTMVKVGAFTHLKELKDFDFNFQKNINEKQICDFTSHWFIHQNENIVFLGSSGVGKTPLATSIGISTAKKKDIYIFYKMSWFNTTIKKKQA